PTHPAAMGEPFKVPGIAIVEDGQAELFEDQHLAYPWNLAEYDATITQQEFPTDLQGRIAEVDIDEDGKVALRELREIQQQLTVFDTNAPQSESELAVWLDQHIHHPVIPLHQSQPFMLKLVQSLTQGRGLTLDHVVASRFRVRDAADLKIEKHRRTAATRSF